MRLSHAETQALISARLDGPLDPVAERELTAHLATCDSCRAFSTSASQLARGLQGLPYLPASPAVTRAVLDHVSTPRSPLSWLTGSVPANAIPAASAIAAAVIVVFVGSFAAFRFLDDGDEPSTIPASTLSVNDLAQRSTVTAEATLDRAETANTVSAPTDAVGQQAPPTGEPALPTRDANIVASEATDANRLEPTNEPATDQDDPIGPPPTPTSSSAETTSQLQLATDVPAEEPTPAPTAEPVPTEAPTAENTPDPSQNIRRILGLETAEPTSTLVTAPTAEPTPEPTVEPTAIPTVEPTAIPTEEPTAEPTSTPVPTALPTAEPTATPTTEPTAEPTPEPTAPPTIEPTAESTPEPTAEPTAEPTPEPTTEPTPTVVPIISVDDEAAEADEADEPVGDEPAVGTDDSGSGDDVPDQTVGPSGIDQSIVDPDADESMEGDDASPDNDQIIQGVDETPDESDGGDDEQVIEPTGGEESETEPDIEDVLDNDTDDGTGDETTEIASGNSLAGAEVYAQVGDILGDPALRLGLSADGQLIFSPAPGQVSLERNGISLETAVGETGQVVQACANGDCVNISAASATSQGHIDNPIGWLGDDVIYERLNGDQFAVEFRAITLDAGALQPGSDRLIDGGEADLERFSRPYEVDGALLVPAPAGWLRITSSSVDVVDGSAFGSDLNLIRVDPEAGRISYVSGGTLIVANLGSPGSPEVQIPFSGSEYAVSPDGTRIAVVTGAGIEIWDTSGNVLANYASDGIKLGSIVWLNDGLVFVDLTNGELRILEP